MNLSHLVQGKINVILAIGDKNMKETVYVMRNQRYNFLSKGAIQALNFLILNPAVYEIEKNTPF